MDGSSNSASGLAKVWLLCFWLRQTFCNHARCHVELTTVITHAACLPTSRYSVDLCQWLPSMSTLSNNCQNALQRYSGLCVLFAFQLAGACILGQNSTYPIWNNPPTFLITRWKEWDTYNIFSNSRQWAWIAQLFEISVVKYRVRTLSITLNREVWGGWDRSTRTVFSGRVT